MRFDIGWVLNGESVAHAHMRGMNKYRSTYDIDIPGFKNQRGLGCDFFGSVTYTHIRVRRFAKFFPSHEKVSYAKVSYLHMLRKMVISSPARAYT